MKYEKDKRAQTASLWLKQIEQHKSAILASISGSTIYEEPLKADPRAVETSFTFVNKGTTAALFSLQNVGKIAVLNFASFLNPGGGFLAGADAQEETLCHESTLYPILCSNKFKLYYIVNSRLRTRGLYAHRALYTPNVLFFQARFTKQADVITCAAPNTGAFIAKGGNLEKAEDVLYERAEFIFKIASLQQTDTLVLGAWGCGVFGNDPYTVSDAFCFASEKYPIPHVVFAVPDRGGDNRDAFERVAL